MSLETESAIEAGFSESYAAQREVILAKLRENGIHTIAIDATSRELQAVAKDLQAGERELAVCEDNVEALRMAGSLGVAALVPVFRDGESIPLGPGSPKSTLSAAIAQGHASIFHLNVAHGDERIGTKIFIAA